MVSDTVATGCVGSCGLWIIASVNQLVLAYSINTPSDLGSGVLV